MLEAQDVTVRRRGRTILDSIRAGFPPGTVTALLGPNGAGKSTLLGLLAGEGEADAGRVLLDGRDLRGVSRRELAQRRAVLPQANALPFAFTVEETVALGRIMQKSRGAEAEAALIDDALARTDCLNLKGRNILSLSGGEQQRVHLARVLVQLADRPADGAAYMLLDEPISALDLEHQHRTLQIVRREADQGLGVLIVLHDLDLAAAYADRAVLLAAGRCVAAGVTKEVLTAERIGKVFAVRTAEIANPLLDARAFATAPLG
jgi:iron complex transport system ATP-binding protein